MEQLIAEEAPRFFVPNISDLAPMIVTILIVLAVIAGLILLLVRYLSSHSKARRTQSASSRAKQSPTK